MNEARPIGGFHANWLEWRPARCANGRSGGAAGLGVAMNDIAAGTGSQPLAAGLRVVEFTHMVMGPTCGMMLADMGAEVDQGRADRRRAHAAAARRRRRLLPDVQPQQEEHRDRPASCRRAPTSRASSRASADVVVENFKPGTMAKYGLDYAALSQANPRAHLREPQGLPAGPVRSPHGARRSRADDGRPRLHDRAAPAIRCAPAPASTTSWAACSARSARSAR